MSRTSTFAAVSATLLFVFPTVLFGQDTDDAVRAPRIKPPVLGRKFTRLESRQVASELERQQQFLRGVTSRFEAVAIHDFTPLLKYSYVWKALYENRARMGRRVRSMSAEQSKLFTKGYDVLEKEVVASFGDYQLSILNDTLELNEMQLDAVQKAVEDDLNARRTLLKTKDVSTRDLASKLEAISSKTETRIVAVLFPEQKKLFEHQSNVNRDRLMG